MSEKKSTWNREVSMGPVSLLLCLALAAALGMFLVATVGHSHNRSSVAADRKVGLAPSPAHWIHSGTLLHRRIHVECTGSGSPCGSYRTRFVAPDDGLLLFDYRVPPTHCGPFQFEFWIDDQLIGESGPLSWQGGPVGPLQVGFAFEIEAGKHSLEIRGFGLLGGCIVTRPRAFEGDIRAWMPILDRAGHEDG